MKQIYICIITALIFSSELFAQNYLSLEQSIRLAMGNNVESKNSKLETEAAAQTRKAAFTNYFPDVSAGGMMWTSKENLMEIENHGGNLPVYDGNKANLKNATQYAYLPSSTIGMMKNGTVGYVNIVQPVFAGGRIINGNRLASLGREVAEKKESIVSNKVVLETWQHYWQVVSLDEKYLTVKKYEELLQRLLSQSENAYSSGLIMKNDVLKVKLKLSEIQLNLSKINSGRKLSKMAFCRHIGIDYDSSIVLNDKLEISELPAKYFVDKDVALLKRNEYLMLEKSVEAAELYTSMKYGEYLPQVAVGLSGMYMKFDQNDSRNIGLAFGTVSIPVSGWWGGTHEIQESNIKEQIARNNFDDTKKLLLLQMEKSWQDLNDSYKQYLLSIDAKNQAEENMKVNEDSYKNGLITVSDLLEAQAIQQQTEEQLTDAKSNYKLKIIDYLIVTGRNAE